MARRSDHNKEELKNLALMCGEAILCEQGLAGLSARGVAARMGYTVGTLYHVFGSLDGYILQLNARTLDVWFEYLQMCTASHPHTIEALAKGYLEFALMHPKRWLALFEHHLPEGVTIPEWYQVKMDRFFIMLEEAVQHTVGQSTHDARVTARLLWSGIHGITILVVQGKFEIVGEDNPEALAAAMVARLLKI